MKEGHVKGTFYPPEDPKKNIRYVNTPHGRFQLFYNGFLYNRNMSSPLKTWVTLSKCNLSTTYWHKFQIYPQLLEMHNEWKIEMFSSSDWNYKWTDIVKATAQSWTMRFSWRETQNWLIIKQIWIIFGNEQFRSIDMKNFILILKIIKQDLKTFNKLTWIFVSSCKIMSVLFKNITNTIKYRCSNIHIIKIRRESVLIKWKIV